ncbi:MAG: hypothetical protein GX234_09310 [Clostridiales bacterium]|nr:hypothetical protein [Clostridiales bacterium]
MNIGEARKLYSAKLNEFWQQKRTLARQKQALEKKCNSVVNGKEIFANEAATLELSYQAVSDKYEEYHNYMEQLSMLYNGIYNTEVAKQQGETMAEYAIDIGKILEVARRISKGAKVPATDEKKLMDYSMELYMSAKNLAMLNEMKKKEEYDSLWDEDEEKPENPDPQEVADNTELNIDGPELVEVSEVMAEA